MNCTPMDRKTKLVLFVLCLLIAVMDITGLPAVLLTLRISDVAWYVLPLLLNFLLIGFLAFFVLKLFRIHYPFGFRTKGLKEGLKSFGGAGILAGILSFLAFYVGLFPFDYKPTLLKLVLEGVVYYIGVGIVEEFYVRGLFLNLLESLFEKQTNRTSLAILISSIVFGLGHIPGMLGMSPLVILFKVISTIGMGFYFGTIYKKSGSLWTAILLHIFIDVCALPYCFTQNMRYEAVSLVILLVTYTALLIYSLFLLKKND